MQYQSPRNAEVTPFLVFTVVVFGLAGAPRGGSDTTSCKAFFEPGAFSNQPEADAVMAERLSEALRLLGERPLCELKDAAPIVRILAMPTFGRPRMVRVDGATAETPQLTYAQLSGRGGYELGTLAGRREIQVHVKEADQLRRHIDTLRRWLTSRGPQQNGGFDGTTWLIEAKTKEGQLARRAWSPDDDLGVALRAIVALAGDECGECR